MMGKLTEYRLNSNEHIIFNLKQEIQRLNDLLQEYKRLEEQGLLLRVPCKVGDTVYEISEICNYEFDEDKKDIILDGITHKVSEMSFSIYDLELIGETVFLTREEAEQKLKEMEG